MSESNNFKDLSYHDVVAIVANTVMLAKEAYPEKFKVMFTDSKVGILCEGVTYNGKSIVVAKGGHSGK